MSEEGPDEERVKCVLDAGGGKGESLRKMVKKEISSD